MSTGFTVRLDDHAERALDELTRNGTSRESAQLLEDPHDLAELGAARKAMGVGGPG